MLVYDRTSDLMKVNDSRKQLFTMRSRALESIPPTQEALRQHVKRARLQSVCWNQALELNPRFPDPSHWGWKKNGTEWQPLWTILPEASQSCYELNYCGHKRGAQADASVGMLHSSALHSFCYRNCQD